MAGSAFTFGVKPGGLTENTEVRILLCYLIKTVAPMAPLTRAEIEQALLGEQLVNYFELSAGLADLEENGLATVDEAGGWRITPKGLAVADELSIDLLPRTVREAAVRAAVRAQQWARKAAQHKAEVEKTGDGYAVRCSISEMGSKLFGLEVLLPDAMTAEAAKNAFIEHGSDIYALVLGALATPDEKG